jgi:hypothetical protein
MKPDIGHYLFYIALHLCNIVLGWIDVHKTVADDWIF